MLSYLAKLRLSFEFYMILLNYIIKLVIKNWCISVSNNALTWNNTGSWGITAMAERRWNKLIFERSIPSTVIEPSSSSESLSNAVINELFPAPVLPTTPIFEPDLISKVIFFNTRGADCWYRNPTLLNLISPLLGQFLISWELSSFSLLLASWSTS